eukprot:sb/3471370/
MVSTRRSFNISDLLESNKSITPAIAGSPPTPGGGGGDGLLGTGKTAPGTSLSTPTTIGLLLDTVSLGIHLLCIITSSHNSYLSKTGLSTAAELWATNLVRQLEGPASSARLRDTLMERISSEALRLSSLLPTQLVSTTTTPTTASAAATTAASLNALYSLGVGLAPYSQLQSQFGKFSDRKFLIA